MATIIIFAIAYLLGSVSCAILVAKFAGLPDPRTQGSGNPGATNILRMAGKQYAIYTLLGDALKGFIPVVIAKIFGLDGFLLGLVALCAVLGHVFPLYFKFKGGKGVATALGCYFALSFYVGAAAVIVWIALAYTLRYASVASFAAVAVGTILTLFLGPLAAAFFGLFLVAVLIVWQHRQNIERLRQGQEHKINFDK